MRSSCESLSAVYRNRRKLAASTAPRVGVLVLVTTAMGVAGAPAAQGQCPSSFAAAVNYVAGAGPRSVAIGDVNRDGKPDLAVANQGTNNVSVLLGNGDGTFAAAVHHAAGSLPTAVAIGDVSGDGKTDLAVANQGGNNVSLLLNNGASIGLSPQPLSQSVAAGANVVFTATATGTGPFAYQWRRNNLPIIGATTGTLTIPNVTSANAGSYDVQIRGGCNPTAVATSKAAVLTVGICRGDFNLDAAFDGMDVQDFVNALLAGETCP